MSKNFIDSKEVFEIISNLEQANYNHAQWYNEIIRTIVCDLPVISGDLIADAHKQCRFGCWYYSITSDKLLANADFIALGQDHMHMHQLATKLLTSLSMGQKISTYDYDAFSNSLNKMRLELDNLRNEFKNLIYTRDMLTGALNRVHMLPILREQQALVSRGVYHSVIAVLDLDYFKKINDEYGHAAGDTVLISLARFIIENIRPYDKLFRTGGDEFLIFFQHIDMKQVVKMVTRLQNLIEKKSIKVSKNVSIHTTVSIGIAAIEQNLSIEQSMENADKALYEAKTSGGNCTKVWEN